MGAWAAARADVPCVASPPLRCGRSDVTGFVVGSVRGSRGRVAWGVTWARLGQMCPWLRPTAAWTVGCDRRCGVVSLRGSWDVCWQMCWCFPASWRGRSDVTGAVACAVYVSRWAGRGAGRCLPSRGGTVSDVTGTHPLFKEVMREGKTRVPWALGRRHGQMCPVLPPPHHVADGQM